MQDTKVTWGITGGFFLIVIWILNLVIGPQYHIYSMRLQGQAKLAECNI